MKGGARRVQDQGGQVVVLYAVALVPLILTVALVLDLAQLRLDRRRNRAVADAAARAAAAHLPSGPWPGA